MRRLGSIGFRESCLDNRHSELFIAYLNLVVRNRILPFAPFHPHNLILCHTSNLRSDNIEQHHIFLHKPAMQALATHLLWYAVAGEAVMSLLRTQSISRK